MHKGKLHIVVPRVPVLKASSKTLSSALHTSKKRSMPMRARMKIY